MKNIHDNFFKRKFSRKEVIIDFLRHNLPSWVLEKIELATITLIPNDFLPSKYRGSRNADLIYAVDAKSGEKIYALFHLEAQNRHDKYMALRVFEYHSAILFAHARARTKKEDKRLPPMPLIFTFVLYSGSEEWKSAESVAKLFEDFEQYVNVCLKPPFLIKLKEADLHMLKKQGSSAEVQLLMKGQAEGDFCGMLDFLLPFIKEGWEN